ncbi:TPA: hypothetical protein DEP21_06065 [Patescibacteria group bacterium]|nr:hypothetical protein [Candidatus Gracilibacteria bacterium]
MVLATKRGDVSAFETLYERWHNKIYAYLWNLLNYNYDDTVSLTSDVFIKFYEYIKHHDIENVKSILYRIAHNAAIDLMRTNQSQYEQSFDEEKIQHIPSKEDHKHEINVMFQEELFQKLLSLLDEQYREVLYLYYYEEKSYEDIADIFGTNKNSIGTLLFTAKKKLNELAEKYGRKNELV